DVVQHAVPLRHGEAMRRRLGQHRADRAGAYPQQGRDGLVGGVDPDPFWVEVGELVEDDLLREPVAVPRAVLTDAGHDGLDTGLGDAPEDAPALPLFAPGLVALLGEPL